MTLREEWKPLALLIGLFLAGYFLPVGTLRESDRFTNALWEALHLVRWYAREHVILCLVPAFFIAGAIAVFVSQASVMKYLGARAKKVPAYGVASVSGSILAVCSCTILPLFAGIYKMGAGLGPATAFLYAGPAINVLAIILTARVLGWELGAARAVGAILFSIVIGVCMHLFFRREEMEKAEAQFGMPEPPASQPLWQRGLFFAAMIGILVFANWGRPADSGGIWASIFAAKWILTAGISIGLGIMLVRWFGIPIWQVSLTAAAAAILALVFQGQTLLPFAAGIIGLTVMTSASGGEAGEWITSSWGFAKQILPWLFVGVLVAGALLGRPGHEGLIPAHWISAAVGGNSIGANLFASMAGAFMYFATLTEVPILQGLIGSGMGKGPALALLLAGPALSLPNMLVIRSVMGTKKTAVYILLVVVMAAISGLMFGIWAV
jgi:uncharacterized membrane protein YraQ (UPF0718 family)